MTCGTDRHACPGLRRTLAVSAPRDDSRREQARANAGISSNTIHADRPPDLACAPVVRRRAFAFTHSAVSSSSNRMLTLYLLALTALSGTAVRAGNMVLVLYALKLGSSAFVIG